MTNKPFTALVLAASRRGAEDSVAQIQNLSHKCLVALNGKPMVQRVITALHAASHVDRIIVAIEDPAILRSLPITAEMMENGTISTVPSKENLADSVFSAVRAISDPFPLIITAADNALHTSALLEHFCSEVQTGEADVYVAMTRSKLILDKYPEGARAFHDLKDDSYSSCNLYALANENGVKAASAFATGGQFGKRPARIIAAFGLLSFLLYKFSLINLDGVMERISKALNCKVRAIMIPWAEGPIDVDNPKDFALVEKILRNNET